MEKKYVMANIHMPVEIKPDGSIEPLTEYVRIDIEKCPVLPEKDENMTDSSVMEQIQMAIQQKESDSEEPDNVQLSITSDDINRVRAKKTRQNMSFKNVPKKNMRYTMKRRDINSNKTDADHHG